MRRYGLIMFAALGSKERNAAAGTKVRVLLVPGFVVDTYSSIEQSLVELSAKPDPDLEFLWLVPDIRHKYNRFSRPGNQHSMNEPVWLPHLRHCGIPYIVGNVSKYNLLSNFLLFRDIFRKNRIDAVYTHFGFERYWVAFFGKLFGKVTIWHERWHSLGRRYAFFRRLFYRLFIDEFISISKFITSTLPSGMRVHTIHHGTRTEIPTQLSKNGRSELRKQLGAVDDTKIVLMVANFRTEKRHMLAFEVCERILEKRTDVVFVFIGDGEVRSDFLTKVKNAGLKDHIVAPGYVDNMDDYYAVVDICILTSYYEPFGQVVLEAMRHGLPQVAFDTGGPAEVIQDGETGFLAKDGDVDEFAQSVLDLIEDEQLRAAIAEKARQVVQTEYSRERWIRKIDTLLKNIVFEYRKSGD